MGETPAMFGCDIMSNEMCLKSVRRCLYLSEHVECKLSIRSHDKVSYGTTIFSQSKVKINFSRLISQRCVYIRCSGAPWADFLKNDKIQKYFLGSVTWNMYRKVRSEVTECQTHAHSAFLRPRRRINRTYSEFWESLSSWQNARRGVVIATTRVTRVETFWNQNFEYILILLFFSQLRTRAVNWRHGGELSLFCWWLWQWCDSRPETFYQQFTPQICFKKCTGTNLIHA